MSDDTKPTKGDRYECEECGFTVLVTEPCTCESGNPFMSCCDKGMKHVASES